ncbi:MAG: siderophore-interacting protein [Microbacteriaceae bacterium]
MSGAITGHLATVTHVADLSPGLRRVTVSATSLRDLAPSGSGGDAVKVFFPTPTRPEPGVPFLESPGVLAHPGGERSPMRTISVAAFRRARDRLTRSGISELDLDFVMHDSEGVAGPWVKKASPGALLGLLGPANAFVIADGTRRLVALADLSALPALLSVVEHLSAEIVVDVTLVEPDVRRLPPLPPRLQHSAVVPDTVGAVTSMSRVLATLPDFTESQFWFAGERALVRDIRRQARAAGVPRERAYASGYWRAGWDAPRLEKHEMSLFQSGLAEGRSLAEIDLLSE